MEIRHAVAISKVLSPYYEKQFLDPALHGGGALMEDEATVVLDYAGGWNEGGVGEGYGSEDFYAGAGEGRGGGDRDDSGKPTGQDCSFFGVYSDGAGGGALGEFEFDFEAGVWS